MTRPLPLLANRLYRLGFATYRDYLATPHWRAFKAAWRPRRMKHGVPACEFCLRNDVALQLHHKTYRRLGAEWAADVVLLCEACHERVHAAFRRGDRSLADVTRHVASVVRKYG